MEVELKKFWLGCWRNCKNKCFVKFYLITDNKSVESRRSSIITDDNPPKADVVEGNKNIICDENSIICDKVQGNKKLLKIICDNIYLTFNCI